MSIPNTRATVPSSGRDRSYVLEQADDGSWSCSCPAWRNQRRPNDRRACKHMVQLVETLGEHIVQSLETPRSG